MPNCVNHPDREAVVKCRRCGKNYCGADVEKVGKFYYCFDCLNAIAVEARGVKHSKIPPPIAAGAIISVMVGMLFLLANSDGVIALAASIRIGLVSQALSSSIFTAVALAVFCALMYFVLAIGMLANSRWSVALGIVLNILVFFWKAYELVLGTAPSGSYSLLIAAGPLFLIAILFKERHAFGA